MAIDGCKYSFVQLTRKVLPDYMAELRQAMKSPHPMTLFATRGVGPKTIIKELELDTSSFPGCYVLIDSKPKYVGISRDVIKRLRQHVRGTTHFAASLAYRIATARKQHRMTRSAAMSKAGFRREFERVRRELAGWSVAFIPITNPLELHLFEAYCAIELDTSEWNTFETH